VCGVNAPAHELSPVDRARYRR